MPTSFASSTYDETNGFDDKSPISYLKVDYTADGGIDSIKVKPYKSHTGKSNIRVTIAYRDTYIDMQDGNGATAIDAAATLGDGSTADGLAANLDGAFDTTPYMTPIYSAVGEVTTTQTELQAINTTIDQTATSTYQPFSWNAAGWWIAYMMYGNDEDMAEAQKGDLEAMLCDAAGDSIGLYPTEIPIRIYAVSATGTILNTFYWDDVIKVGQAGTIEVPSGGDTPTDIEISSVALNVTAPKIGETPATTATTSTTGVVANPAVTWDPADSAFAKNQAYKASVTLSADSGYKFTDSTTATINGKTATVTLNGDGTLKAEYTFDAIKLTSILSNKTGLTSSFAPNDRYTVPSDLEVTLTYSDGTTEVVPYNQFSSHNLSLVIGADTSSAVDLPAHLTLGNNNQTVYVKYSGTDTNDGNPKYQAIDTITVANAKISTAQVSITYPKPGETPDTAATVPSDANYTAEVTWQDSDGTDVSGNFEYDKAYNAIITIKPNTGYALDNTNGVALTVKDKTAANPGADKTATIASDDIDIDGNGEKTVSFDATASTPISASISDSFDLYDKNDVNITLTLGTHVIGDITGITIDGQTLSSSDYTISGNIITVKGASLATKLTDLTSTAANKNVEITVTGQQKATTATLSAIDTTPYITITDPTQGAITGVTHTSGTKVALTKNTAYTLSAPTVAHTTGYTWTVSGITGTDNGQTYTFTPSGSENITATVALTVDAGHKLTINKTGNGTVTVAKDGGSTLTAESDGTYTVYSDESYTVTATADDQNKVTAVTGETISGVQKTVTHAVANPTADTTVEVTFATKTAPTVSADMTYRKGTNDTDKVFTITLGDYSDVEIGATTPSGTWAVDKATYTVSKSDLETASNGDHTYTFDFGEGMTITKKISVLAARSIENVTAPTGPFAHGDTFNLTGLSFTVKEDGIDTKYTYDGTNWDKPIPTETKFSLDGSTPGSDWDTFKTVAEAKITRHDTTDSNAVNNGAQITVSLGTPTKASNDISVGTKAITVNPSQTTDINKVYDGTVTAPSISATIPTGELVGDDKVTASVTAVYQDGVSTGLTDKNASDNVKNVVFTGTLSGANAGNYTIKAIPNGSGKINKRTIKIAIIKNVPAATKNKADTKTGHATAIIPTNTEYDLNTLYKVVDGETVEITYDYSYASISRVGPVSDVTVTNIATTNTNYTVEPTYLKNQNGTVNNRTIESIAISDPTKNKYNYSDTFDPTGIKVTVKYDGETDPVDYDWNAVPDDITLKWTGTEETLSATHKFDSVGTYTITASANGVEPATTKDITVNKLKVSVTASGNITKVYDGKTDLDADDAITYDVTNQSAGYDTQFNADTVTVSNNPAVYDGTSVSTNGVTINKADLTLSNSNYEIENFTNNVTASITARHITVTAITVPTVKQYSNDTDVPANNVGTSAVTFDNVVSGENVTVDYKYTYNDTSVAGDTDDITINNLVLNSTNTVNNNYTLDESTPTKSGHVDERTVNSLTVTAPTQFATAQTYGTALALAGLKVQVNFTSGGTSDGSETYVWKDASTWTKQVEGQSDVDVTTVPFTLAWSGTTDVPTQGETLTVQRSTKGITASYTGTSVTGTSDQITVNPITLTKIKITGTDQTKVYDGNADLTPNPAFTYAITEGIINSDPVTVAPNTVEYAEADVHTSEPLNITGFHLTNNNDGNYALGTPNVTGTPNGTITKRPITLTAITNIPAINRFEAGTGTDQTATSAANGGATFEAAGTDTGIVSGQTVTVIYNYEYDDNQTVSNNAVVNLSNVRLDTASDKNYSLTNNATATGVVNEVEATAVTVTIPDKTYEYGDKLDLTGTTVTVDYGNTNTEVYTSDDGVNWKKNNTAVSEKPFTITLPTDKDSLAVGTATVSVKVKDGVEDSVSRTVNKRKVTVTPAKNGDVTKVYNGNTTYTNGVIEWTVRSVNSIDGLTVTLPTVSSATYTYNDSAVALANKITVSDPQLSDTNNFEINGYTDQEFDATITLRPLVITGITIPDVNKYADVSQEVTGETANSATNGGATFEATGTDTGIVSGETVGVTFDYKYVTSNPESGTTTDVDISNIALDNRVGTSANYSLTPNSLTGSANVVERTIDSITVANPTQFNSDVTYNDKLSIAGLKVTINYTDRTSEVYTATVVNDVVSWALGSVNISADNIPFTLSWKDTAKGGTFAQGQTLSVTGHNGNQIVANHKNGNDSGEGSAVTIKPIEITSINATKNGDITKTYDGTTTVTQSISYEGVGVLDADKATVNSLISATANYDTKDVAFDSDGTTVASKAINFTNPTMTENDNYTMSSSATVTTTITGKINPKALTVTITSVPSIIVGQSKTVTLTKTTNYTQSGEVTVGENTEEVNLTVVGEYAQNTTAEDNVNVTYSVTNKDSYKNYNIIVAENPTGTVNKKPVTKIEVTSPTKTTWSHGDDLTLDGMTITVTYNNDDTDKKQYKHTGGKWHDVTGGSDAELSGTPDDVTITWGDTSNSATDGVIRLDDTNKGLTADGNNKTTSVKVTSTVKDTNGEYQSASTGDITLTKKQLTLTVSGNVEKPYDKTNNLISGNNVTLTLAGVAGTDGVALNETATKNNIKYAGTTVAETASSLSLVIGTVVLNDSANNQYYTVPSGASITNSTTGKINKRPVQITSVTKNMNTSVDASTTGTLEKLVQSTTDGYGISSASGFYSILSGHEIKVDIPYEYRQTSAEGSATVTYDNATAKVSDENADYVANYEVSFAIADGSATISNGTVTGVKIETTGKTEYTHGDSFDLKGTKITVTYNNGAKQDTYKYDTASGKWIKNDTGTPAELPSEIGISLGNTTINANPASDTDKTVVKYDKTNTTPELKATYTKSGSEPIPSTENPTVTLKKKTITITVANSADEIKHTYSGNNSLTGDEITKLTITAPNNFKVGSDDVTLTKGTLSATIGSNTNGNVDKNLAISVSGYELSGNDADKYEIKYVSTATGDITKAPLTITISSVPSINENATDLEKTLTEGVNYTQSGEVNNENVNATVKATYPDSTYTGSSADKNVSYTVINEDEYPNYDITIIGSPKGTVTQKTATVEIINQPKFVTDTTRPQHGDKLGTDGLNGFEYTVSYSDGTTTKHKYADGDWLTTGGYTAPEDGTAFTWENTNTAVSSDSEIRKDMDNKIKITVPTATNEPLTNKATADKKKVKITANGTYTKVYDGTNTVTLNETTPEITYTVSGVAMGDTVTVTATPAFVDENVAKFGDVYQKAINFTNVSISDTDNYEIENDITPIMGAITPKTINITELTVPSSTKGSAGEKTVTKNKNFTTTDILEKDKDNVTIGYKATFVTSATGTVDATVTDAKVDGSTDQMTLNYVVGTVTGAKIEITSSNHGGGGGGGGGGNSLSIKYENADGTAGKDVSKIEAPAGSDPVDLIAVFVTKPANPTVIWTSDNESVATVDENGIVKFIGEGTAIITAQSKTNKTLKDTVTVTVTKAVATPTPKPANPIPEPTKEPSIITKTMLNPYIVGYDDNVFGPELPISREEVSAIFARLIANNIYMDKEYDTSFPDVGEGWSKDYIGYLEKFSVVTGYEDGTFRPQNYITRAEMAVMMAKAEGYDISGYMSSDELAYPDVDEGYSEWAVKAIKYLTDRGIMEGYPDGTFGPNRPITRAETVATVNRVLADMTVGNIEVLPSDMTEAHWAYNDVVFAMNHRILKDVAADESQFIKSEEYDKNKITETEVVEDTSDENAGAGASPTPEPSPTPNA